MKQRTLRRQATYSGIALHTGTENSFTLRPAPDDTGIVFRRVDLEGSPAAPARIDRVVSTDRCTTVAAGDARVSTIEHLMAALRGMDIDNVYVDIDGPEVPIADGSAAPYVELIDAAGAVELDRERSVTSVTAPVWVRDGNKLAVALPYDGFKVSFTFTNDHDHPVLGDLHADFDVAPDVFRSEIAAARTIGWLSEVEKLQERGLALGATIEMAVVLSEDDIVTPLRFADEPVRHKILDSVGDLALVGYVHAHVICLRSNHALNVQLARSIAKCQSVVELSNW